MKVQNMESTNGNPVPNQFIIYTDDAILFQSYNSIIAKKQNGKIYLDCNYWDYSKTTSKYRNQFLRLSTLEIKTKIANGSIILTELN